MGRSVPVGLALALPLLVGAAVPCPAAACSCGFADEATLARVSPLIVVGRLARDQTPTDEASVWITVEHREKGRAGARRLRVLRPVWDFISECGCGPRLRPDRMPYRFYLEPAKGQPGAYRLLDSLPR